MNLLLSFAGDLNRYRMGEWRVIAIALWKYHMFSEGHKNKDLNVFGRCFSHEKHDVEKNERKVLGNAFLRLWF